MSSFTNIELVNDYSSMQLNRTIYADYRCNCKKFWTKNNSFIVYKARDGVLEKLIDKPFNSTNTHVNELISLSSNFIEKKMVVSGGHTVINLKDRLSIGKEVVHSVVFCAEYMKKIHCVYGIKADFLIMLNDFFMEKDAGADINAENNYRKDALDNYILPKEINSILMELNSNFDNELKIYFCSEKNMADRFKRHIQKKKKQHDLFYQNGCDWYMRTEFGDFTVIDNNKPNCVSGNAATFRAIRYNVESNKIRDNYKSFIGVWPLCSMENVLNGYLAANKFYQDINLPSLLVFFGKACFDLE